MNEPTHLDLFSGIGGFALAARWAGFRTIAFCEIDKYCHEVRYAGRVATKVPNRVQKLKGLGNSIVPQVAYEILREIRQLCPPN